MRQLKKLSLAAAAGLLVLSVSAHAVSYEYPYIYKDPRAMGMGGASVAVGGGTRVIFANPAGLARAQRGFEVELLPLQVGAGDNVGSFFEDLSDALDIDDDSEQRQAVNAVLREYRGRNMHLDASMFPNLSWRGDTLTLAAGLIGTGKIDARAHQGMGSDGLLEVDAQGIYGPVFGVAYDTEQFSFGGSVKLLTRHLLQRTYSVRELVERSDDDHDEDFSDDVVDGSAVGIDLGVLYKPWLGHPLSPTLGFSLLNVGGMDFGDAGEIPMTANVGLAIQPYVPFISGLTLAVDYVDIFREYPQDEDILKRLHLGAEAMLWRNTWSDFALRAGMYQGYLTAGLELRLTLLTVGFATYAEEVGAYAGQDKDRRYLLTLSMGW